MTPTLEEAMRGTAADVEDAIDRFISAADLPEAVLYEAMRYACLNGGKRLRPLLVVASSALFGVDRDCALRAGVALEFVHCYSLVHDDLPAMDDSDLRRGRPSVHKQYDEAVAILVGDALQALAFEILAHPSTHSDPLVRSNLVFALARAAGVQGMVGGQMLDLIGEVEDFDAAGLTRLQRLKTGALISFGCEAGALLGRAPEPQRHALQSYAHDLGLAFQIIDDVLDVEGDAEALGKPQGADAAANKTTFVSLLGLERAKAQASLLVDQAIEHLGPFEQRADLLREIARFVLQRRS